MKWSETTASKCRYGDVAGRIFGEAEVIWEHSEDGYSGFANVLVRMPDGRFGHYEWTYGSCSRCDEWENLDIEGVEPYSEERYSRQADKVEQIMRDAVAWFDDEATLRRYLRIEDPDARYVTANSPTNGSTPGMGRLLFGGIGDDFTAMGEAFERWATQQPA